ncbi:MAG: glycerophosphodiester phosphodiesterase [Anaerolineales bacterium]|nr:glycerophosphodiester phosphodiesterase [Anaerolineales bacterium]
MHLITSWNSDAPLVIAHRGASLRAPENTLAAFRLAEEMGADAIELDAKLTKDGHVVVHHDRTLERTTDGEGLLAKCTLEELKRLDAGSHFNSEFKGERIPTLQEVFDIVGKRTLINIELSNYATPWDSLPSEVVKLVNVNRLDSRVLFSSFSPISLLRVGQLAANIPRGLLVMPREPTWVRFLFKQISTYQAYHPHWRIADQNAIQGQHKAGRRVYVWTVNEPKRMTTLIKLGVDGVITDTPEVACKVISQMGL